MDFRGILGIIRSFFSPLSYPEVNKKRRAIDPIDLCKSSKLRRLQSRDNILDIDRENYYLSPKALRRSSMYKTPSLKNIEPIVLDDDDNISVSRKLNGNTLFNNTKTGKFTSTPYNQNVLKKNGTDDDDVSFIKELKSPSTKKADALKKGLNYIRPCTGSIFKPKIVRNERQLKDSIYSFLNGSPSKMNSSIRLDEKKKYKEMLESTQFFTPRTSFNSPMSRRDKMMSAALSPKCRMSTKDTIQKVLNDFESDTIVIKDSDSDSDVVFVSPPSPKPDIKVEPVNSLKKIVDTSVQTKTEWLDKLISNHQQRAAERQLEIDILKDCSEKHEKINKNMRIELLSNKINRSLQIKDAVLPEVEKKTEVELPPLTDTHLKLVNKAFKGDNNEILSKKFNLNIKRKDLLTLAGLNWLNDEVINFYMNMIIERGKDSTYPKAYAFNTFFYPKLVRDGHQSLRRWTKKVDIFAHDIICVPIHLGMHWCMAIIDMRAKTIKYYDSMGSSNDKCLGALRNYLEKEHLDKKNSEFDTSDFELENVVDIPQQMNGSDCGMFACTFAEFLTRDAEITFSQEHMPYLRKKMVVEIMTGELLIK